MSRTTSADAAIEMLLAVPSIAHALALELGEDAAFIDMDPNQWLMEIHLSLEDAHMTAELAMFESAVANIDLIV